MTAGSDERRRARRVSYPCEARCYGVGEAIRDPQLTELSATGAFIHTVTELPLGSIVLLRFELGGTRVKAEAEVVHVRPQGGMGVRFLDLAPELGALIERIRADELSAPGQTGSAGD